MLYCFQSPSPPAGEGRGEGDFGNGTLAIVEGRIFACLRYNARYRLLTASLLRSASMVSR